LDNGDLLKELLEEKMADEMPAYLHSFFEAHGKDRQLLKWAIEQEILCTSLENF
jgi:hypothetical protein